MKKILLTIAIMAVTSTAFSQDFWSDHSFETKITFGLIAGTTITAPQLKSADLSIDQDYSSSFSGVLGINADFKFNDYFSIRPGLAYIGKSTGLSGVDAFFSINEKYDFYYLEFPLDFIGHVPFSSGANIFLGGGPYIAKGMSASVKETIGTDATVKQKLKYGSNGDLKPMDYGITTTIGFQAAKSWSFGINFDIGGTNIIQNSDPSDTGSMKLNTLYFNVGLNF